VRYTLDTASRRVNVDVLVDWREEQTLLRAEFPTAIRARFATCGIQFGSIDRPTHRNTSWEQARFEVPGHRWMDLSEPGRGLAVLDEAILGRSIEGGRLGLSLVRAPSFPDPTADRGQHRLRYALMPHGGDWRRAGVDAEAEAFNNPLVVRPISGDTEGRLQAHAPFGIDVTGDAALEVAALKPSEDGSGAVLRLIEKHGAHGVARIDLSPHTSVGPVNLRERSIALDGFEFDPASGIATVPLRPYGIVSLRMRP
jgi:alpha-mannosidase